MGYKRSGWAHASWIFLYNLSQHRKIIPGLWMLHLTDYCTIWAALELMNSWQHIVNERTNEELQTQNVKKREPLATLVKTLMTSTYLGGGGVAWWGEAHVQSGLVVKTTSSICVMGNSNNWWKMSLEVMDIYLMKKVMSPTWLVKTLKFTILESYYGFIKKINILKWWIKKFINM